MTEKELYPTNELVKTTNGKFDEALEYTSVDKNSI